MNEYIDELRFEIEQEENIDDISEEDISVSRYDITSYGVDFDVEGLVRRVNRGEIYIPEFQRDFVWKMPESSRFIESLLLGLPVPGIFLAQDQETGKLLVIDGQQRLLTLKYFFEGYFNPKKEASTKRVFKLVKVQDIYEGETYETLAEKDRLNLDNSVIHATVVKQDSPADDDTSIYHIFERLNSGGRKLTAQEIRTAVYHGNFISLLNELNNFEPWRNIFGDKNNRMRDQELILRFFAMLFDSDNYKKPMNEFLNKFITSQRNISEKNSENYSNIFKQVIELFEQSVGARAFRLARGINVAFFESAMVGLANRVMNGDLPSNDKIKEAYDSLVQDEYFQNLISHSTADAGSVEARIEKAKSVFMDV